MDSKKLVGRYAADKSNRKIGKIIRVVPKLSFRTKKEEPHIGILVQRFLRKDVVVYIEETKITKVKDHYVWFDISRKEFTKQAKTAETIKEYRREFLANKDYKPPQRGQGPSRK